MTTKLGRNKKKSHIFFLILVLVTSSDTPTSPRPAERPSPFRVHGLPRASSWWDSPRTGVQEASERPEPPRLSSELLTWSLIVLQLSHPTGDTAGSRFVFAVENFKAPATIRRTCSPPRQNHPASFLCSGFQLLVHLDKLKVVFLLVLFTISFSKIQLPPAAPLQQDPTGSDVRSCSLAKLHSLKSFLKKVTFLKTVSARPKMCWVETAAAAVWIFDRFFLPVAKVTVWYYFPAAFRFR